MRIAHQQHNRQDRPTSIGREKHWYGPNGDFLHFHCAPSRGGGGSGSGMSSHCSK